MARFSVVGLGLLTVCASASAYPHTPRLPAPTPVSVRVRPPVPTADQHPGKPALDADAVLSIDDLLKTPRTEQEQIIVQLIANTPDSEAEEKADYYFRLGALYAQLARYWREKGGDAKAKDYLLKTVKTYKALVDNDAFRTYPKLDIALFYYGYTLQGGKYLKEARAVYDKLLKNFPNSKYVPEAHLAFGEYYFETNQLADAEARYAMVLKFPKSSAYWYAMYKMGWIHLGLQRYQEALETFFQIVQATKADAKADKLNQAAKHDFVRAYAAIGKADKAGAAFKRVDVKDAFAMLTTLADLYVATGMLDKAAFVYGQLMIEQPESPKVCAWQAAIARASLTRADADKLREIASLVTLFGALAAAGTLPGPELQTCHDDAAALSGELARVVHLEANATKSPTTMATAEQLYAIYLAGFPEASDRAAMQYFHAETLWSVAEAEQTPRVRLERWETAADAFAAIAATDVPTRRDAALASVVAWKSALDLDPDLVKLAGPIDVIAATRTPAAKPIAIPAREGKLLTAFEAGISFIADADEVARTDVVGAIVLRRFHQLDTAIPLLADVVEQHGTSDSAELAGNLLLEALVSLKRYDAARELADRLHDRPGFVDGKASLARNVDYIRTHALRR